ncbi:MAG: hypothetical protein H6666_06265 [Ardenticatenaceae bacterium]|nr:hypothetical protein [Ardenticatenaceae bacterium]
MKYARLILGSALILLVASVMFLQPGASTVAPQSSDRSPAGVQPLPEKATGDVIVSDPVLPILTVAARDLPPYAPEPTLDREINPRVDPYGRTEPDIQIQGGPDPLLPLQENAPPPSDQGFETPIFNFEGQGYTFLNPPDTVGDIGANHYIQMINSTGVAIYDKTTGTLITSFDLTALGGCATGSGDPIVLYDHDADRWLLSEFGSGNSLCVFISQTPDPTGTYYAYSFSTPSFPDYPKYGVWSDAYYASANENSPSALALNRTAMLAGAPATSQRFTVPPLSGFSFQALTPADWDGATPPPAGSPNYFMRHRDTEVHGPSGYPTEDFLEIWAFDVDWVTPANSSFTQVGNIAISEFDSSLCGLTSFYAIAMPGVSKCSTSALDPLREVIMFRLQYRNFGSHQTLVGNLSTDVTGNDDAGVRWFELRKVGAGAWSLFQEGTYAPDAHSRWMGAIAMDGSGNIALGYNVSSGTVYPSLRYTGRLASDPLGTMPQGENMGISGSASNGSNRYGDYAAMSVDPVDDCTFWFTGEYNPASQWSTRIIAFRFDACGSSDFSLTVTPNSQDICAGSNALYDVAVGQVQSFNDPVTLSASGNPAPSTTSFNNNPVIPPGNSTLTIGNTGSVAAGSYDIDVVGVAPTSTHTTTVQLNVFTAAGTVNLVSPPNGAINVPLSPNFNWTGTGTSYTIEIATDAAFTNIVESATVATTNYTSSGLGGNFTYYWRVTADNVCGGSTSPVWHFTTVDLQCSSPNLAIPDNNPAGVTNDLVIANGGTIDDLNVSIDVTHTWVGDTVFSLTHVDTGTTVTFYDRPGVPASTFGCSGNDIDATLDDEAATPVENECGAGVPAIAGSFIPNNALAAFDGEDVAGTWRITAYDLAGGDTGTLNTWCVDAATTPTSYVATLSDSVASGGPGETVVHNFTLTNLGLDDTYDLTLSAGSWSASLLTSTPISVLSGNSATIQVAVDIPAGAMLGDNDSLTLTATSQGDPLLVLDGTGTTTADGNAAIGLTGDLMATGTAGQTVTYTLEITNDGDITDTFDLALGASDWTAALSASTTGPLAPGASITIEVYVTVGAGSSDAVDLTVTSQFDPSTSTTVTMETSTYLVYLPVLMKP